MHRQSFHQISSRSLLLILLAALWCFSTELAYGGLNEELRCVAKNKSVYDNAVKRRDNTRLIEVINTCLSDVTVAQSNVNLRGWLVMRVLARMDDARKKAEKFTTLPEKDVAQLLADASVLTAQDFSQNSAFIQEVCVDLISRVGQYRAAQQLLPLGGKEIFLTVLPADRGVLLLHVLAAITGDAAQAKQSTARAQALESKLTPVQLRDMRNDLAPFYAYLGKTDKALALIRANNPHVDPCNTPQKTLKELQYRHSKPLHFDKYIALYSSPPFQDSKDKSYKRKVNPELLRLEKEITGELSYLQCVEFGNKAYDAVASGEFALADKMYTAEIKRRENVFGKNAACTQSARLMYASDFLHRQMEFDKAREHYDAILQSPATPELRLDALLHKAETFGHDRQFGDIRKTAEGLVAASRLAGNPEYEMLGLRINALLYFLENDELQGEKYFNQAEVLAQKHGKSGQDTVVYTSLLFIMQNYVRALSLIEQRIDREKQNRGSDEFAAPSLFSKAFCLLKLQRTKDAVSLLEHILTSETHHTVNMLPLLSAEKAEASMALDKAALRIAMGLLADNPAFDATHLAAYYNLWLQNKGLLLETQGRIQEALAQTLPPDLRKQKEYLNKLRLRREHLPPTQRVSVDKAIAEQEKTLKLRLPHLLTYDELKLVTHKTVASALPENTALVDFAKILHTNTVLSEARTMYEVLHMNATENTHQYVAFVLKPDGALTLVRLGDAPKIDTAIAAYRRAIQRDPGQNGELLRKRGEAVYELLFAPLRPLLGEAAHVYVSGDGQINTLPLETLPVPEQDSWLVDAYTFSYLSAPRDLLRKRSGAAPPSAAIIVGNPDFASAGNTQKARTTLAPPSAMRGSLQTSLRDIQFGPLPATEQEAKSVAEHTAPPFDLHTGSAAQKSVMLAPISPPRRIHLATHGFFLPDDTERIGGQENAMLRSGLAFAGAASADALAHILLAEEVSTLNLHGTDMVVLSACQTGLGDIKNGEGVYGLQRAFALAGAARLIMSMWSVPDKETGEMMQVFYEHLHTGMEPSAALRSAMLRQKELARQRYGYVNPLYWGAFVSVLRHR